MHGPTCYADKRGAALIEAADRARECGHKVITGDAAKKIAPHGIYGPTAGGYVALDEKDYYGGEYQSARKAIKGQNVQVVMIEDIRKGTLVPMVTKNNLTEALKAAGVKVSTSNRDPRDLAREKARKVEKQYRRALFDAHHAAARIALNAAPRPAFSREDLALVARQFWAARGSEMSKILARMYVPDAPERAPEDSPYQDEDYRRHRRMTAMIDEMNAAQLMLLLLDLALVSTLDVPTYTDDIDTPAPLLAAATRAELNVDAIRTTLDGSPPAAQETAPTPNQAAPAADDTAREKTRAELAAKGIKYCHPENSLITWSGRGRKPTWVDDWLKNGGTLEELSTANQAAPATDTTPATTKVEPKGKNKAAAAARTTKAKTRNSGRASPAERKEKASSISDATAPVERCTKTMDLIEATFPELKTPASVLEARA